MSLVVKEEFFRTKLIPAGQVAEIYVHQAAPYQRKDLSQMLFETLGLVSAFAISPSTPNRKGLFVSLGEHVQTLIDLMRTDLDELKAPPTRRLGTSFRASVNTATTRFKPVVEALLLEMKYSPAKRAAWMESVMRVPTPLTQKGQYSKWRTFVRHIDFQENMRTLGLAHAAKDMPTLGSSQGREEAPLLWRECFTTTAGENHVAPSAGALLPPGVVIKSNATGLLDVQYEIDPRKVLKKALKEVAGQAPPELEDLLKPVSFSRTCEFRQLAAVIDELFTWRDAQLAKADETQLKIAAWREATHVASLQDKLSQMFTPEERALLEKANVINAAAKPAAKRGTRTVKKA